MMNYNLTASPYSLIISFALVVIAFLISYKEKLKLEKDIIIAVVRMIVQLVLIAYLLGFVFEVDNVWLTLTMILVIIINASLNVANRGKGLNRPFLNSFIALFVTTSITLGILVFSGNLQFTPSQMIPITGMIVGSAMTSVGLSYSNLFQLFKDQDQSVIARLALGATPY